MRSSVVIIVLLCVVSCKTHPSEHLISKNPPIELDKNEALFNASLKGDIEEVRKLLQNIDIDVNAPFYGKIALSVTSNEEIAELLIENGADVNLDYPIHRAASRGYLKLAKVLIKHGADLNAVDSDEQTPLNLAVIADSEEMVKLLIKSGADVNFMNKKETMALHIAIESGLEKMINLLVENGADVNKGKTALKVACESGDILAHRCHLDKIYQSLWGVGHPNKPDTKAWCHNGSDARIADLFIKNGANINFKDDSGRMPLHWAAKMSGSGIADVLIKAGGDINATDNTLMTPLHVAAKRCNLDTITLLLKTGADSNAVDISGRTPLYIAARTALVELMMQESSFNEETPCEIAIQLLIKNGANLNVADNHKQTLLHLAAERGDEKLAEIFIKLGATINVANDEGKTPLHLAIEHRKDNIGYNWFVPNKKMRNDEVVQLLIENGANTNVKDKDGRTPLHWANLKGKQKIIDLLVQNGADISLVDNDGKKANELTTTDDKYTTEIDVREEYEDVLKRAMLY